VKGDAEEVAGVAPKQPFAGGVETAVLKARATQHETAFRAVRSGPRVS